MSITTGEYLDLDGDRVYYEVAGEGAPLVFVHAGFVDSAMWDDQWHIYARHYRVIRFDMRGFGRSDRVDAPVDRRSDLVRLMRHLGIERAAILGCSLGGTIALDMALEHPEMVAALVVVAAVPGGFALQGEPPRYVLDMWDAMEQGDLERASELQTRIWIDGPFREPHDVDPRVRERSAAMNRIALANQTMRKVDATPLNPLDPPAADRLDAIAVPTLVVVGELDNPELLRAADVMARSIAGARQVRIPDSAHLPSMEEPERFNQAVLAFLHQVA